MFIDQEVFNRNLLLTRAYCDLQLKQNDASLASVLRTFNPNHNGKPLFIYPNTRNEYGGLDYIYWSEDPLSNRALYDELFDLQLSHKDQTIKSVDSTFSKGRILFAEIDTTIFDGASEAESEGFIDVNDCPPIDTWFYMTRNNNHRILFAWIPEKFIPNVQGGIDVNCVDCFNWYDEEEVNQRLISYAKPSRLEVFTTEQPSGFMQFLRKVFRRKY